MLHREATWLFTLETAFSLFSIFSSLLAAQIICPALALSSALSCNFITHKPFYNEYV